MAESIQCYQCGTRMTLLDLVKNQDDCPECGAMHSINDVAKALELNARAQLPSLGGEAVEVVGYGCTGQIEVLKHVPLTGGMKVSGRERDKYSIPLMTVAQHQRILAAATHPADQVPESMRALLQQIADNKDASHFIGDLQDQLRALLEQKP